MSVIRSPSSVNPRAVQVLGKRILTTDQPLHMPEIDEIVLYRRDDNLFWLGRVEERKENRHGWRFDIMPLNSDLSRATPMVVVPQNEITPFNDTASQAAMRLACQPEVDPLIYLDLERTYARADETIRQKKNQRKSNF